MPGLTAGGRRGGIRVSTGGVECTVAYRQQGAFAWKPMGRAPTQADSVPADVYEVAVSPVDTTLYDPPETKRVLVRDQEISEVVFDFANYQRKGRVAARVRLLNTDKIYGYEGMAVGTAPLLDPNTKLLGSYGKPTAEVNVIGTVQPDTDLELRVWSQNLFPERWEPELRSSTTVWTYPYLHLPHQPFRVGAGETVNLDVERDVLPTYTRWESDTLYGLRADGTLPREDLLAVAPRESKEFRSGNNYRPNTYHQYAVYWAGGPAPLVIRGFNVLLQAWTRPYNPAPYGPDDVVARFTLRAGQDSVNSRELSSWTLTGKEMGYQVADFYRPGVMSWSGTKSLTVNTPISLQPGEGLFMTLWDRSERAYATISQVKF